MLGLHHSMLRAEAPSPLLFSLDCLTLDALPCVDRVSVKASRSLQCHAGLNIIQ